MARKDEGYLTGINSSLENNIAVIETVVCQMEPGKWKTQMVLCIAALGIKSSHQLTEKSYL